MPSIKDEPPLIRIAQKPEELDGQEVQLRLVYDDKTAEGRGKFQMKRIYHDQMMLYVDVLSINWHSGGHEFDRYPIFQQQAERIVPHPQARQGTPPSPPFPLWE